MEMMLTAFGPVLNSRNEVQAMSISDRITELRIKRGINVTQLCSFADISWVTYKRLIAGEHVKESTMQRIADTLNTTPEYILTGDSSVETELLPNEIDVAILARNIKSLRASRNWRGTDMARHADISYYTLLNLENVRMIPCKATIIKLAHALDVTPMDLCTADFQKCAKVKAGLSLGRRMQALRLRRGYTLRDLEQVSLISYNALFNIERGLTPKPTPTTVTAVSKALGVTPDEFLNGGSIDEHLLSDVLMCTEEYTPKIDILIQPERLKRGLTVGQLAKLSGLAPKTIERAEYGLVYPSYITLLKLAEAMGLQPKDLIKGL